MRVRVAVILFTAASALMGAANAADMKLRKVFLSQGGVAYYEFAADVDGAADLTLDVPRDQVDDIMKSLVVFDDKGAVGSVSLPGEAPLAEAFRGLPFGEEALYSLPSLLNALKGEQVEVGGARSLEGRILTVDEIISPSGGAARQRLSLMTAQGVEQIFLDEAERVNFADPGLTTAVNAALNAFAEARSGDSRRLRISHGGKGAREVRVGYVAVAPLWKTSYRLTVDDDGEGRLQGWAILENYSGQDWDSVELTLASGNPVTFHQALYSAYFVERPEVPVELYDRILPSVDRGAMDMAEERGQEMAISASKAFSSMVRRTPDLAPTPPAAHAADTPTQIVFEIDEPVTLATGQSLMLPLVDKAVPARRVAHIGGGESVTLAAVALENESGTALPPGVLTLYDRDRDSFDYLGDARMGLVPAGQERLLSFAADTKIKVSERSDTSQNIASGRISGGVLQVTRVLRHRRAYEVAAPKGEPRQLAIDIPAPAHWTLVAPKTGARKTETGYRLSAEIAGGARKTVEAVFEESRSERFELVTIDEERILAYMQGGGLSDEMKRALQAVAERKQMVTTAERRLATVELRYQEAAGEQERLRESVKSVAETSDLAKRYMAKLGEIEDRIESLSRERREGRATVEAAREQLRAFIRGLEIG